MGLPFRMLVNYLITVCVPLTCGDDGAVFQNDYDLHAYNNVRDILYKNDVITNIVKSIVHSPVGKLV